MAYETIEFKQEGGIARLTLNRPDRLNSFTVQMHEEVADALVRARRRAGAGHHRRRPRLLRRPGSERPGGGAGGGGRSRRVGGENIQSADPAARLPALSGDRAGERSRGRRRRQYRARLRHRHRRQIGEVHPVLRRDRPDPGQRRHLGAAPPGGPGARARPGAHRRAAAGREGGRMGADLEGGRGRGAGRRGGRAGASNSRRRRPAGSPGSRR